MFSGGVAFRPDVRLGVFVPRREPARTALALSAIASLHGSGYADANGPLGYQGKNRGGYARPIKPEWPRLRSRSDGKSSRRGVDVMVTCR